MGLVTVWSELGRCVTNILPQDRKITTFTNIVLFSIPGSGQSSETK